MELRVQASLQRRGHAIRLVVSQNAQDGVHSQDDRTLVHSLAQAHQWLEQLLGGEVSSLRMIAGAAGKSERYVSKLIRLAFLAPDLVEALLEGRAPSRLTLAELTDQLPWDWNEQRRRFAVVLAANKTSPPPRSAAPESLGDREIGFDRHHPGQCPPQTALKFEFSLLHQAGEFELSGSLVASGKLAAARQRRAHPSISFSF